MELLFIIGGCIIYIMSTVGAYLMGRSERFMQNNNV